MDPIKKRICRNGRIRSNGGRGKGLGAQPYPGSPGKGEPLPARCGNGAGDTVSKRYGTVCTHVFYLLCDGDVVMYRTKNEILTFPSSVWLPGVEWYLGAWTATTSHAAWDGRWPKATAKSKVFLKKIRKKKVNTKCKEKSHMKKLVTSSRPTIFPAIRTNEDIYRFICTCSSLAASTKPGQQRTCHQVCRGERVLKSLTKNILSLPSNETSPVHGHKLQQENGANMRETQQSVGKRLILELHR